MASKEAYQRLKKELASIKKSPPPYIDAAPLESNILEWHYVVLGPPDSPYEGGLYHGKLRFPSEYPFKPPSIYMITPSGRFKTNTRLCLSISDFHPQSWKPVWSVASILTGLLSFMLEETPTTGSIDSTFAVKRLLAEKSWQTNLEDTVFREVFPELCLEMKTDKVLSLVPKRPDEEDSAKPVLNPLLTKGSVARKSVDKGTPLDKVAEEKMAILQQQRAPGNPALPGNNSPFTTIMQIFAALLVLYLVYLFASFSPSSDL